MLCTHKTTILCQFGLFCHQLTTISPSILNHFWWELYQINSLIVRLPTYPVESKLYSTQNGFVTKEFVKIDEDSQTQDYTIIYIRFQGQTPPFSIHNRDIFERLLPTPFPQVGDILSEEEDSESEQELIA